MPRMSLTRFVSEIEALPASFKHTPAKLYDGGNGQCWFDKDGVPGCTTGKVGICAIEAVAHNLNLKDEDGNPLHVQGYHHECGEALGLSSENIDAIVTAADEGDYVLGGDNHCRRDPLTIKAHKLLTEALDRRAARLRRNAAARKRRAAAR